MEPVLTECCLPIRKIKVKGQQTSSEVVYLN
jgi:hypothetical protein